MALTFATHAGAARFTPPSVRRYVPPFVASAAMVGALTYGQAGVSGVRRYVDGAGDRLMEWARPVAAVLVGTVRVALVYHPWVAEGLRVACGGDGNTNNTE